MSTETTDWREVFGFPRNSGKILRMVRNILRDCLEPKSVLEPPKRINLSLQSVGGDGVPILDVLDEVHRKIVRHAVNPRHPWAIAHMVPPPSTISVLADLVIGAMNQCAFIWEEAPAAFDLEREVIRWLLDRFGCPVDAQGLLTSGGTMSNFLATFAALDRERGCHGNGRQRLRIIVSDQAHLSIDKAAALCGLGVDAVHRVRTNDCGRLVPGDLHNVARRLADDGFRPFLIVCTAGTTNAGTVEPFSEAMEVAHEHRAWCHLDAAHGGLLSLSSDLRGMTSEWRMADSISWDPHKTLYTSYATGALLFRDALGLAALDIRSDYALKQEDEGDAGRAHFEGSRRMEALKIWMTIKHFGVRGFSQAVDKTLLLAREFATRLDAANDFTLITEPDTNIVCFRYKGTQMADIQVERLHEKVQKRLFLNGGPLLSTTRIHSLCVFRCVFLNPLLEVDDLDPIIGRIRTEAQRAMSTQQQDRHEHQPLHEPASKPLGFS